MCISWYEELPEELPIVKLKEEASDPRDIKLEFGVTPHQVSSPYD